MFLWPFGPFKEFTWQLGRMWAFLWTGVDLQSYDGLRDIQRLSAKNILLIHGVADKTIPVTETEHLAQSAGPMVNTWFIVGADHLQGLSDPNYSSRVMSFLSE
jgi:fermentation-respiration switch protein FrsA (DUF1100 family)